MVCPFAEKHDVARAMTADRQMRHDDFGGAARRQIAVAIRKADDGIGVANINPLRVGTGRIEGDAERTEQAGGEYACRFRSFAVRAQYADTTGSAFGGEDIAVWRHPDKARMVEP